jgi:hypothetical protein
MMSDRTIIIANGPVRARDSRRNPKTLEDPEGFDGSFALVVVLFVIFAPVCCCTWGTQKFVSRHLGKTQSEEEPLSAERRMMLCSRTPDTIVESKKTVCVVAWQSLYLQILWGHTLELTPVSGLQVIPESG